MQKKVLFISGAIIILVVIATISLLFYRESSRVEGIPDIYRIASAEAETTVLSVTLDDNYPGCAILPENCADFVKLRIEEIDRTNDPDNKVEFDIGDEIQLQFEYTARPAKLRYDLEPFCTNGWVLEGNSCKNPSCSGDNCPVSSPLYQESYSEFDGSYIIFHFPKGNIAERTLPGVNLGDRIRITLSESLPSDASIREYEKL